MMRYRRLGRTNVQVSEIGFGTCQLRMVPVQQALDTLLAGFELGVNVVHTSFDYGGAVEIVEEAVRQSTWPVHVCSNGWGSVFFFEELFEEARERFGRKNCAGQVQLGFFGIACPEDRDLLGDDTWGIEGLMAFLQRKKRQGVLAHSFCTTHGAPDYIRRLIVSDAFDAVIFALNPLGHHLLSFNPPADRDREAVRRNAELFELAAEYDVGIMLMEVLGGGLLCESLAFPDRIAVQQPAPRQQAAGAPRAPRPRASALLRCILREAPDAASVLPGTASVAEAIENARAGHGPADVDQAADGAVRAAIERLSRTSCSRCGQCEPLCGRRLPVSWLFRASDIERTGAVSFETPLDRQYFELHPVSEQAVCDYCVDRSCRCPVGLDIPAELARRHAEMMTLLGRGEVAGPLGTFAPLPRRFAARRVAGEWNGSFARVAIQNTGSNGWYVRAGYPKVHLEVVCNGRPVRTLALRAAVPLGGMAYFAIDGLKASDVASSMLALVVADDAVAIDERIYLGRLIRPNPPVLSVEEHVRPAIAPYRVSYRDLRLEPDFKAGGHCVASIELCNEGGMAWEPFPDDGHAIHLMLRLGGAIDQFELPQSVAPGQTVRVGFAFDWPFTAEPFALRLDMVRQKVAFFSDLGSPPLERLYKPAAVARPPSAHPPREAPVYGVEVLEFSAPGAVAPKARFGLWVRCRNTGTMVWEPERSTGQQVRAIVTIDGVILVGAEIPHRVGTGEACDIHIVIPAPAMAGSYTVGVGLVHEGVAYFKDYGIAPLEIALTVDGRSIPAGADLYDIALRSNWAFYHPSGGVSRLADGTPMPQILEKARGCHVWDGDGRRYIDYTMGWGSSLLGHGHDLVEAAVRRAMGCGPTLPLPHRLELDLTDALCQTAEIPCAEVVAFGKNGSDVCTLAVRVARAATGRLTVLICGYHGWQDWYCEALGFPGTGVPARPEPLVLRVAYNDTPGLLSAIDAHRADLAAVIMEPSGASGGPRIVGEDVDQQFLRTAASATREAGALLIFDEIITGFRYAQGSVQQATGIVPDMACFGKALGNGFPISVLVGRRAVMNSISRAFYGPTFKGEVYSLAAAQAALSVYRAEPVAEHVQWFGQGLQQGIARLCSDAGIDATMAGPPFRCVLHFNEADAGRRRVLRTLYIQELLRGGLITYNGVMLPSFAHTAAELDETLAVVGLALRKVARCADEGLVSLHRAIEMPLLTP